MFCDNCGNQMDDNAGFCENCGKAKSVNRVQSNPSLPNDPNKGVKFIGFDQKVPRRGSNLLRNWILGILLALIIVGLNKCTEMSGQKMYQKDRAPASTSTVNNK